MLDILKKFINYILVLLGIIHFWLYITGNDSQKENDQEANGKRKIESSSEVKDKRKPLSLINIGATCYMNSAFQGISSCGTFVNDINMLCEKYDKISVQKLFVFRELIDILHGISREEMNIASNTIFQNWNKSGQQDSYELLAYAMNEVYNELRKHKECEKKIPDRDLQRWLQVPLPMRFILDYTIYCGCGNVASSPFQSDLAFHVTIPQRNESLRLSNLIDLYFNKDEIEDYNCDDKDCNGSGAFRVARLCTPLPRTICIHLQRTHWTGESMEKLNNNISFETSITIKPEYMAKKAILKIESKPTQIETQPDANNESPECFSGSDSDRKDLNGNVTEDDKDVTILLMDEDLLQLGNLQSDADNRGSDDVTEVNTDTMSIKSINCSQLRINYADDGCHSDGLKKEVIDFESNSTVDVIEVVSDHSEHQFNENDHNKDVENEHAKRADITDNPDSSNDQLKVDKKDDAVNERYELVSVIVHFGTVDGGHYICYKRVADKWFFTSDTFVQEVTEYEVLHSQAYILFYEQPLNDTNII